MMVRRSIILLVLVGCGDEFTEDEEKALKDLVKDKVVADASEKEIIWKKDGKEMVLIPAGSFEMGDHFDEGRDDELPVHTVQLDAFYMDSQEVTVEQFRKFVDESGHKYSRWNDVATYSPTDEHPMILVTWHDATAYAKWAGKRLPTEKEWEFAARGGLKNKKYPWGDDLSIAHEYAHYDSWNDGKGTTKPVGNLKPNGYGLFDMAGNVWEWCQDWYDSDHDSRVLRGGSWSCPPNYLRAAYRVNYLPADTDYYLGFRCVSGF